MENIVVIGGGGFIGRAVTELLCSRTDVQISILVRNAKKSLEPVDGSVRTIVGTLNNDKVLASALSGQDVVVNLAYDFKSSKEANFRAFDRLVEQCIKQGVKRLIHISSIVVYDDWPSRDITEDSAVSAVGSEYRQVKVEMERRLKKKANDIDFVILQPTIVYGPRSWLWTDLIVERLSTGTLVLPDKSGGLANLVFVDDVARAVSLAIDAKEARGNSYIISGNDSISWRDYFEAYDAFLDTRSLRFEPVSAQESSTGSQSPVTQFLANPLSAANWKIVRSCLNVIERLLGDKFIQGLKSLLLTLRGGKGHVVYYPSTSDVLLYGGEGRARIEKARADLGYEPEVDFQAGFEATKAYLTSRRDSV